MAKKFYSDEFKKEVLDAYALSNKTVLEIHREYGVCTQTINNWVKEAGIMSRRSPQEPKRREVKSCSNCRKKIDVAGARFCPFCGADIRSPEQVMAERLRTISSLAHFLPNENQDEFLNALYGAIKLLEER